MSSTTDRWDVLTSRFRRGLKIFVPSYLCIWIGWICINFQRAEDRIVIVKYVSANGAIVIWQWASEAINFFFRMVEKSPAVTENIPSYWDRFNFVQVLKVFVSGYGEPLYLLVTGFTKWALLSAIFSAFIGVWLLTSFFGEKQPKNTEKFARGAQLISWRQLKRRTQIPIWNFRRSYERKNQLYIGQVPLPAKVETLHFLLTGSTGTGKSQTIYQLVEQLRYRPDKGFVLDLNGALASRFFYKGDLLLNPLDNRSVKWNPFLDLVDKGDVESLVQASIPTSNGESEEWKSYARTLMTAVLYKLKGTEDAQPSKVVYFATQAGTKELAALCQDTTAQRFFEKGNEKLLSNSLTLFAQGIAGWGELKDGGQFSMRQWVREGKGWLFINVRDKQLELMRPLLTTWFWLSITETLNLPEDSNRRLWFFTDELASFNALPKLDDALAKLRKYGGIVVSGLQDVAQLDVIYGRDKARALRNCFSNFVGFRCEDPETAHYVAERVGGEQEFEREATSTTKGSQSKSSTRSQKTESRNAILDSEVRQLNDRHAYLKIAGNFNAAEITIPISEATPRMSIFVPKK